MDSLKVVIKNEKSTTDIKNLIEVYEEIAASKMQKIRKATLDSQAYFDGLAALSDEVALDLSQYYEGKNKFAAVFLSSETGLYGDLIEQVMVSYVNFIKKDELDAYVVGKLGASLMKSYAPEVKFTEIDFSSDTENIAQDDLSVLMNQLSSYSKIYVFHGRFESIARQTSVNSVISGPDIQKYGGTGGLSAQAEKKEKEKRRYVNIYEPDVNVISEKFGREISASIIDQSVKENQLAKYAARLMHLDGALDSINKKLENLSVSKKRMRKKMEQKKQTERIARWQRL